MQPFPKLDEQFENGNISLKVYRQPTDPITNLYCIQVGIVYMDLNEREFYDLIEMLDAYNPRTTRKKRKKR